MKSHLIPVSPASPVWETNNKQSFLNFLNIRSRIIISEIEKHAGAKLFEPFDNLKRI
jgi:hypothetical protein